MIIKNLSIKDYGVITTGSELFDCSNYGTHLILVSGTCNIYFSGNIPGNYAGIITQDDTGSRSATINFVGNYNGNTPIRIKPESQSRSILEVYFDGSEWFPVNDQVPKQSTIASENVLSSEDDIINASASSPYTIGLPSINLVPLGKEYFIFKGDNNSNVITISGFGSELINDATTYSGLAAQFNSVTLVNVSSSWAIKSST